MDDWHAWQIRSQITVATSHVDTTVETLAEAESLNQRIHEILAEHGVDHATVELCPSYAERQPHLNTHMH